VTPDKRIYMRRFASNEQYRTRVWKALVRNVFQPHISLDAHVLDLGCGYGEFINNVRALKRYAIDANPDSREKLASDIDFVEQDCTHHWPFADGSLDVIFSSNLFEHLPTKEALYLVLEHAKRALRRGGTLIAMGPNIRYVPGEYWDFIDHRIALSDRSIVEAMEIAGFRRQRVVGRFLPYAMSETARLPPLFLLSLYLRMPVVWRFFGKQFLVIMKSSD
jgi:SAM-dependent methyltransferase